MPDLSGPPRRRRRHIPERSGSTMKVKDIAVRTRARKIDNILDAIVAENGIGDMCSIKQFEQLYEAKVLVEQVIDIVEGNDPE